MSTEFLQVEELEGLLDERSDELYTYLIALCRDRELARDLLQTVFLKFIEQVEKGRIIRATAEYYLKTMCRNEYLSLKRKTPELSLANQDELPADQLREKIESNSQLIRIILLETIASPELPPDIALVLRLRLVDEIEVVEICRKMNKSRSTVQRLMNRGTEVLARAFEEAGLNIGNLEY